MKHNQISRTPACTVGIESVCADSISFFAAWIEVRVGKVVHHVCGLSLDYMRDVVVNFDEVTDMAMAVDYARQGGARVRTPWNLTVVEEPDDAAEHELALDIADNQATLFQAEIQNLRNCLEACEAAGDAGMLGIELLHLENVDARVALDGWGCPHYTVPPLRFLPLPQWS